METIGSHMTRDRYSRWAVKARLLREVRRRIEAEEWTYKTVQWGVVQQHPINDDYDGSSGPVLAILDGLDEYSTNAHTYQNLCDLTFEFALVPGEKEEPSTMLNLIAADLVEVMAGDHTLEEGGHGNGGDKLACGFYPQTFEPDITEGGVIVTGILTWQMRYRTKAHKPFDAA